jgi:type I restriction enzyme M protein
VDRRFVVFVDKKKAGKSYRLIPEEPLTSGPGRAPKQGGALDRFVESKQASAIPESSFEAVGVEVPRERSFSGLDAGVQGRLVEEKVTREELGRWLWGAADILRGAVRPERYGYYVLPLLFFKRLSDVYLEEFEEALAEYKSEEVARQRFFHRFEMPEGCLWSDVRRVSTNVGARLNEVLGEIAKANPPLDGVVNRVDFNNPVELPVERLVRLVEHFSQKRLGNRDVSPDMLGDGYEYLLKMFNEEAPQRAGEFYTPREVVRVLVGVLKPEEGFEVYDPCCGSGGMLIESYYHLVRAGKDPKKLFLFGQEINPDTLTIAKMNVILHGLEAEIHQGDTFADPKFLEGGGLKRFDLVIANPMWNQDGYASLMENDRLGRFQYGVAPKSSADWGWIQHMLASLKPSGRMGIVLDQGALFRGGAEGRIREKVVEADLVECVVGLPEKLFYNTGAPGCLIFLNKRKPPERRGKVLFIYAGETFEKLRNMNRLRDEDIEKIVQAYEVFKDIPKYSRVVRLDVLKENDYNLSVTRYVSIFDEPETIDVARVWKELKELEEERQRTEEKLRGYLRELGYEQ